VRRGFTPDVLTDQTSAHDPLNGYIPAGFSPAEAAELRHRSPDDYIARARASIATHVRAMLHLRKRGAVAFDYGNNIRTEARGAVAAPIVIGRDHLDTGSVASPFRETEGMRDGSDAIADWAILNALLNTASGASWVSFHHGGGVGIGNSLHAGQVIVADGTAAAARRLERVLTNDPGIGVARHADAGYPEAIATARLHHIRLPMSEDLD